MSKQKKSLIVLALICSLGGIATPSWAAEKVTPPTPETAKVAESTEDTRVRKLAKQEGVLVDTIKGDVDGDGKVEVINLLGSELAPKSNYRADMYLVTKDAQSGQLKQYLRLQQCGGYDAYLTLSDVTGNGVPNVLVAAPTGGSGGLVDYRICDFAAKEPQEIFSPAKTTGINVVGRFLPDYKVELAFPSLDKTVTMDLAGEQELYRHLNVYDAEGQLLPSGLHPFAAGFSNLSLVDLNNDEVKEVVTAQRVVGAINADTLGFVRTVWAYKAGQWVPSNVELQASLYNKNAYVRTPEVQRSNYTLQEEQVELKQSRVAYPRMSKLADKSVQWELNKRLAGFAQKSIEDLGDAGVLELNYQLKYPGKTFVSLLFTGMRTEQGKSEHLLQPYTLSMATGQPVELKELFKLSPKFWELVATMSKEQNVPMQQENYSSFYYDGNNLTLINKDKQELVLEGTSLRQFCRATEMGKEILTNQSSGENESKKKDDGAK